MKIKFRLLFTALLLPVFAPAYAGSLTLPFSPNNPNIVSSFDPNNPAGSGLNLVWHDEFTSLSTIDCNNTKADGFNWYIDRFDWGVASNFCSTYSLGPNGLTINPNGDGGPTLTSVGRCLDSATDKCSPTANSARFVGSAFGAAIKGKPTTGLDAYYIETSFAFVKTYASYIPPEAANFWGNSIQEMTAPAGFVQWPGQTSGYDHHIESDIVEFDQTKGTATYLSGSISGNVLTVTSVATAAGPASTLAVGLGIGNYGATVQYGTITKQLTGSTGGVGTYTLSSSGSVANTYLTAIYPALGHYSSGVLDWSGKKPVSSCAAPSTHLGNLCVVGPFNYPKIQLVPAPDWTKLHRFGQLYVRGTAANHYQGYILNYFDGALAPSDLIQTLASGQSWTGTGGPMPAPPAVSPWAFSIMDSQTIDLQFGGSKGNPITVRYVRVYGGAPSTPIGGSLPDVVVTSESYSSATGLFTSVVKNQGAGPVPAVSIGVAYSVDGNKVTCGWATGPLAAGASVTVGSQCTPYWMPRGTHTIVALANDSNRFTESNTANNTLSQSVTIP
jgi:CARDB